jgi:trk system potassium uptake protein TrkH
MHSIGGLILLIGALVTVPVFVVPFYPQDASFIPAFIIPGAAAIALGALIRSRVSAEERVSEWQSQLVKGSLPVLLTWCFAILLGALPFTLGGQLNFLLSLFESVSGWTTTGLTVADVTVMPRIFLFHRSFMQYCGGLGFVLMMLLMVQSKQSVTLFNAEGHPDRLMPSLKKTARIIFFLYAGCLIAGAAAYIISGMEAFDAVCHAMSAISTAGFSTRAGSIGEYNSVPAEIITIVLMITGATNFAVLLLLVQRKFKQFFKVSEQRFMLAMTAACTAVAAFSLVKDAGFGIGGGLIEGLFGVVTTFSTTGYATMDYSKWPPLALGIIILMMFVGGGTGSTAGGIKLSRAYLLIRITRAYIRRRLSPSHKISIPSYYRVQGETPINDEVINDVFGFVSIYVGVFITGALLITQTAGCPLFDAMFEFASALGTVGISNGLTNPGTDAGTLIIEMVGMILGRLEVFIVFVGVYSGVKAVRRRVGKG